MLPPSWICLGAQNSILSFLKENSFTNIQLQTIVKHTPRILTASFEDDLKFKIKILKDFGFSLKDIAKLLTAHRALLNSSAEKKIVPQQAALKSLIGSNDEVVKLVKGCGLFMYIDLEKTLVPNLQLLRSSGVDEEGIRNLMCNKPRCLLVNPDAMRRSVEKVNEIGADSGSKGFVYAIGAVASMKEETWELKLQGFKDMGFWGSQVLQMFKAAPTLPSTSRDKIKAIKELLIATGRFDLSDIVKDPCSLMCSIELRYKPRFQILEILDSKKVIRRWPCLRTIHRMPHDEFFEKFIRPYSEHLGEVSLPEGCLKKGEEKGAKSLFQRVV